MKYLTEDMEIDFLEVAILLEFQCSQRYTAQKISSITPHSGVIGAFLNIIESNLNRRYLGGDRTIASLGRLVFWDQFYKMFQSKNKYEIFGKIYCSHLNGLRKYSGHWLV